MSLPLSHIKVVEICRGLASPMAAMYLADQGAEVIKIEAREGDTGRSFTAGAKEHPGMSMRFLSFNRNKRSMVVDFTKPQGLEVVHRLVRQADVLIINVRVDARHRRGLAYEDMAAINPRLVYTSITGYGDEGPEADLPGADVPIQARSGDLAARRPANGPPPGATTLYHFDMATPMLAVLGICLALYERERTGRGQMVGANLLQSALALQALQLTRVSGIEGGFPPKLDQLQSSYLCSDGRYIYSGGGVGARWEAVWRALGLDAMTKDPRFSTPEKRQQNDAVIHEMLAKRFATRPAAEWEAILKAKELGATVLNEITDLYNDPQVKANDMIIQFEQPGVGLVKAINAPFTMSEHLHDQRVRRPVPTLGQHTQEVLQELGYSMEKIEALKKEGVVA